MITRDELVLNGEYLNFSGKVRVVRLITKANVVYEIVCYKRTIEVDDV